MCLKIILLHLQYCCVKQKYKKKANINGSLFRIHKNNSIKFSEMKKKIIIINVFLSMAVLFSILLQSIHSYEHNSEQITAKLSNQHHSKNKIETSSKHNVSEKCFICKFNFYSFTTAAFFVFQFQINSAVRTVPLFFSHQYSSFFTGSLFSLRAPPLF